MESITEVKSLFLGILIPRIRAAVTGLGGRRQLFLGNVPGHGDGDTVLQREYSGAGGGTQAAADAPFVDNGFHNASSFW